LLVVPDFSGCIVDWQKVMSAGFNRCGWCAIERQPVH
jgi:hypothetical protein